MAFQSVTDTPTALSNVPDGTIMLQYHGVDQVLVAVAASADAATPFTVAPYEIHNIRAPEGGESVFVWNANGSGRVVYHGVS